MGIAANLGEAFLFQVPRLIAIFVVITFAILKRFVANLLRNISNLPTVETPQFLLETPQFLLVVPIFSLFLLSYKLFYLYLKENLI